MKCKHRFQSIERQHGTVGDEFRSWWQMRCLTCGDWLPLGPSNDESPEVQVEIRRAAMETP